MKELSGAEYGEKSKHDVEETKNCNKRVSSVGMRFGLDENSIVPQ